MRATNPIVLMTAALLFLSGCGASGGDEASDASSTTEATTTTIATVEVDEWAATFCGNFGTWLDGIQAASASVSSQVIEGDYESAQTAISALFGTASEVTGVLIAEVEAALSVRVVVAVL